MEVIIFLVLLGVLVGVELLIYRHHGMDDLSLDVQFSKPVAEFGEVIEVIETAQNNKKMPLPFLILKFEAPTALVFLDMTNTSASDYLYREDMLTMKPFSRHTRRIKVRCTKRGYFSFARVIVSSSDLLLLEKFHLEFDNQATITILPEIINTRELLTLLSVTFSDIQQRRTLLTDPFAFSGIREYQSWDPMKSINWTATARAGEFMVNENASTSTRQVTIFLNLEYYNAKKSDSLLEKSISMVYSYMIRLIQAGITCALFTNGKDVLTDMPVSCEMSSSQSQIRLCGESLARIDRKKGVVSFSDLLETSISRTSADDCTLIVSPRWDTPVRSALRQLKQRRPSMFWLLPYYKTGAKPAIEQELSENLIRWELWGHD